MEDLILVEMEVSVEDDNWRTIGLFTSVESAQRVIDSYEYYNTHVFRCRPIALHLAIDPSTTHKYVYLMSNSVGKKV